MHDRGRLTGKLPGHLANLLTLLLEISVLGGAGHIDC